MIPVTKILKGTRTVHNERKTGPLFVWNITSRCNLKCSHCYRESTPSNTETDLSDKKCIELVSEIKELMPPIVLLTGGEPLLRKNVFEIAKECKSKGLRVGLSTNGTLIDTAMAERIKDAGIDYVGISIDGAEVSHDIFRCKKGAYSASWEGIRILNGMKVKTGVRFTVTGGNSAELIDVLEKTVKSGTKRFCLYHLVYAGRASKDQDMTKKDKRLKLGAFFKKVKDISLSDPEFEVLTTDNPADGIFMARSVGLDKEALGCISSHGGCSAGDRVVYLDSTGEVYPCQFLRDIPLGNVTDKTLKQIWKNTGNLVLAQMRDKKRFLTGKCGTCGHKAICGGCRARAKAYHGSLWAEDPACYLEESELVNV